MMFSVAVLSDTVIPLIQSVSRAIVSGGGSGRTRSLQWKLIMSTVRANSLMR
jgi:hypothetical protein